MEPPPRTPETSGDARFEFSSAGLSLHETTHRDGCTIPRHEHEQASVNIVLDGVYNESIGQGIEELPPGSVLYKPPGEPHANRFFGTGARCILVEFDSSKFRDLHDADALPHGNTRSRNPSLRRPILGILSELGTTDDLTPSVIEELVTHVLTVAQQGVASGQPPTTPPNWLASAREVIQDRYGDRIGLADVARELGLHPSHLARAWHQRNGEPLGQYIRRVRVRRAAEQLRSTLDPIASIALRCGFSDQSHLTRCFRATTGVTPAVFRRKRGTQAATQFWF